MEDGSGGTVETIGLRFKEAGKSAAGNWLQVLNYSKEFTNLGF